MSADPIVIASYARTPMGGMQGVFSDVSATQLGATAIRAAVIAFREPAARIAVSGGQQKPGYRH